MRIGTKILVEAIIVASEKREKRVYPNYLFLLEKKPELQGWSIDNCMIISASSIKEAAQIAYDNPYYTHGEKDLEWLNKDTYTQKILGITQESAGLIMAQGED